MPPISLLASLIESPGGAAHTGRYTVYNEPCKSILEEEQMNRLGYLGFLGFLGCLGFLPGHRNLFVLFLLCVLFVLFAVPVKGKRE